MRKKVRAFLAKSAVLALFAILSLGMSETMIAEAWSYATPIYPNGKESSFVGTKYINNIMHDEWTMLDYANNSPYWGVGESAVTSDPTTDYWNGSPVVYKYGLGTKVYFTENENKRYSIGDGYHAYSRSFLPGEEIPVWYWVTVDNPIACHNSATSDHDPYTCRGFLFRQLQDGKSPCNRVGDSTAWLPVCAICGKTFGPYVYASANAVADMPSITNANVMYLYSCRICGNMEQGSLFTHSCIGISTNQYNIRYNRNTNDRNCTGATAPQTVFYKQDSSTGVAEFNGSSVTGALTVSESQYIREGYVQVGWNTKPDGSGVSVSLNGSLEPIYNNADTVANIEGVATDKNEKMGVYEITLYAQWQVNSSTVKVNAGSGFNGGAKIAGADYVQNTAAYHINNGNDWEKEASQFIKSTFTIPVSEIICPTGWIVTCQNEDDNTIITSETYPTGLVWTSPSQNGEIAARIDINGRLTGATYKYGPGKDSVDEMTVTYETKPVTLPDATGDGLFVGWYTNSSFEEGTYVGTAGDSYTPTKNITLYARFAELDVDISDVYFDSDQNAYAGIYKTNAGGELTVDRDGIKAVNDLWNYSGYGDYTPYHSCAVNNATGAVNITMNILENANKRYFYEAEYKLESASEWTTLDPKNGQDVTNDSQTQYDEVIEYGQSDTEYVTKINDYTYEYIVQETGIYKLDAFGAQGGNFGSYVGGLGGRTTGTYLLTKGDKLIIQVGGQGQSNTGGGLSENSSLGANGGGYTKIWLNDSSDILMIAAGGGGATSVENGNNADTGHYVTGNSVGQSGIAGGGGGGYEGGCSGTVVYHQHSVANCGYHTHSSSCYHRHNSSCYTNYVRMTSISGYTYDSCGCSHQSYTWHCNYCGNDWSSTTNNSAGCREGHVLHDDGNSNCHNNVLTCTKSTTTPTCGKSGYQCGKTTSTIENAKGAYGGRSYVYLHAVAIDGSLKDFEKDSSFYAINSGNGFVHITKQNTTSLIDKNGTETAFLGLVTRDITNPAIIDKVDSSIVDGRTTLTWSEPDGGVTTYNFRTHLYSFTPASGIQEETSVSPSLVVTRKISSAIAGYYLLFTDEDSLGIDAVADYVNSQYTKPDYTFDDQHYSDSVIEWTSNPSYAVSASNASTYVYIAAVDVAGNVGHSTMVELAKTNVGKIVFDLNPLQYAFVEPTKGTWRSTVQDEKTVTWEGRNCYYGYWAIDGCSVDNTGKGTMTGAVQNLSFGGAFPTPAGGAGTRFVGWNSKPDGSGTYYSFDGADDSYSLCEESKEFVFREMTGSDAPGQEVILYAIWTDDATNKSMSVTYSKVSWTPTNGTLKGTKLISTNGWGTDVIVKSGGQSAATGVWKLHQTSTALGASSFATDLVYYPAGAEANNDYDYSFDEMSNDTVMYAGTSATLPNSLYTDGAQYLDVTYNLQGRYSVTAYTESRSSSDMKTGTEAGANRQGSGCVTSAVSTKIKVDRTIPYIYNYHVKQTTLADFTVNEVNSAILNGQMKTLFELWVSDYNDAKNGDYTYNDDSSGIAGVYLYVFDANDFSVGKLYPMPMEGNPIAYTREPGANATIDAKYSISVDLYAEFPDSDRVKYIMYALDRAGNASELNDKVYYKTNPDGTREPAVPNTPEQQVDANHPVPGYSWATGELQNFSIKAVAINDEDNVFNVNPDTGEVYFQTGDIGHIEVWTVGYVQELAFDFGILGDESTHEIASGFALEKYALDTNPLSGIGTTSRTVPYSVSTAITLDYRNGIPYAQHYTASMDIQKWWNTGTSIRIPLSHVMEPTGNVDKYGMPTYKNEIHTFEVIAKKGTAETSTTNTLILWDMSSNDVHYRVIHEN